MVTENPIGYFLASPEYQYSKFSKKMNPFNIDRTFWFRPPHIDKKILLQDSVFICFKNPNSPLNDEKEFIFHDDDNKPGIKKIIIPSKSKSYIRKSLDLFGINHARLFPDMYGCGTYLDWKINESGIFY